MSDPRRDAGFWPARLSSVAALVGADGLAVVLAMRDGSALTYANHNVAGGTGWEARAAEGAVARAMHDRAARSGIADVTLADGRVGRTLLAVPILWQDAPIGSLVALRASGAWVDSDSRALSRAADLVALELNEANQLWRAQQLSSSLVTRDRLRAEIQRELQSVAEPDAILERATRRLAEAFAADGVSMMLVEPSGELVTRAAVGLREDVVRQARRRVGEGIAGWVAQQGQPLLLTGKVEDARFTGVDPSIGGALVAPLKSEDRVLGVVNVKARSAGYGQEQLQDLTSVAQDVARALERADALRRLEDDRRQALVLFELSRLAVHGSEPQGDLETAAVMLADTLRHDVLGIWIAEEGERTLRLRAGRGYGDVLPSDIAIAGDAALQGAFGERRTKPVALEAARPGWASTRASYYILAPIAAGAQAIGVLVLGRADGSYTDADLAFATTLGDYLGGLVQRTASADELRHVASSERRRIAQELHDGLAQELTGVVLALEGCQRALERDPDVLPTQLAKAARDARATLADVRQYMTALRQQEAGTLSLPVTVSRLVDDLRRTSGLTVELEEIGAERALPPQVERAIVRIAQESLHNIAQHAQASRAKVILHYDEAEVTITVEDDGQGFPVEQTLAGAEQRGRFGLLGMKERAESVAGSLGVRSEPGAGTVVQARIPYEAGPRLAAVPAWPGATQAQPGEEVAPQTVEDVEEVDRRGGFLQRLFGR